MNISAKFGSILVCGFRKEDLNVKFYPYGPNVALIGMAAKEFPIKNPEQICKPLQ